VSFFPDLDGFERSLLSRMIDQQSPLDKFLVGPSFYECHRQSFVQHLSRETPLLKDAFVASAALMLSDYDVGQAAMTTRVGHRRAASAVCLLRSLANPQEQELSAILMLGVAMVTLAKHIFGGESFLICRYTLGLIKPLYKSSGRSNSEISAFLTCLSSTEIFECLLRCEVPTMKMSIKEEDFVVDRYLGLSSPLLAHLYDICAVNYALRYSNEKVSLSVMQTLDHIYQSISQWQPLPPGNFLTRFTRAEVVGMLAQARVLRLTALLIVHRLRHPFNTETLESTALSREITAEIDVILQVTKRSIPYADFAFLVASFEITNTAARQIALQRCEIVVNFSNQHRAKLRASLVRFWAARDADDQLYWFNLSDFLLDATPVDSTRQLK
jgi:hypothetical protein